jgi:hypothetical protein
MSASGNEKGRPAGGLECGQQKARTGSPGRAFADAPSVSMMEN